MPLVWSLHDNLTALLLPYVALAEAFGASLLTRDRHLAAFRGHREDGVGVTPATSSRGEAVAIGRAP